MEKTPALVVPGLFHVCLLVAGILPFRNGVTSGARAFALWCARSVWGQLAAFGLRALSSCRADFGECWVGPWIARIRCGDGMRRRDAFAVARGSVWAVMAARLDRRTDSALTIKTGDRNVCAGMCAGMWGPGAKADGAAVWGVIWSGRAAERGCVTSFPKTGEQRRKRLRARSADGVVWQSSRACSAGGRGGVGLAGVRRIWMCFVHGARSVTGCASGRTHFPCGA